MNIYGLNNAQETAGMSLNKVSGNVRATWKEEW
jgi:hypothetical protein